MSELPIRQGGPAPSARDAEAAARPLALFDLDGTLVDTAPDLVACLNHCLAHVGLGAVPIETVRPHAGLGVRVMLERAYADAGRIAAPGEPEEQFQRFLARYEQHIADRSVPFPGALAAMDRLAADGFTLAVCTNKLEGLSRSLLGALGLLDRFAAVCGADTFARRKPDPIHLLGTIERAGGHRAAAIMIGDSSPDVEAAVAAGVPSVLMAFGYGADARTRNAADIVLAGFDELDPDALRRRIADGPANGRRPRDDWPAESDPHRTAGVS